METFSLDANDGATAQLATVVSADLVFSANTHHFPSFGVVGNHYAYVAIACRHTSEYRVILVGFNGMTMLSCGLARAALQPAVDALSRVDKRVFVGLGIAAGVALLWPPSRKWLFDHGRRLVTQASDRALNVVGPFFDFVSKSHSTAVAATQILEEKRRPLDRPRRLRDFAAAALARSVRPLTVEQLDATVAVTGYRARGIGSARYLESVLRAFPQLFCEVEYGYWDLAGSGGSGPAVA